MDPQEDAAAGRDGWRTIRWIAAAELVWERIWPLAVPALVVVLAFLTVTWFGVWQLVPAAVRFALLGVFALVFIWQLARLRHFALPSATEISRRVETASHLEDRPISALDDEIAFGGDDAFSRALWTEHRRRMAERLKGLTAGTPRPDTNRTDPWAMRAFVALLAFIAFGYSFGPSGGRIADATRPATDPAELLTRLDAWINPPAYTRRPPVYLTGKQAGEAPGSVEVPAGSEFFLRFVGNDRVELAYQPDGEDAVATLVEPGATVEKASTASDTRQSEYTFRIEKSGSFTFTSRGRPVSQWKVEVIADTPPSIDFAEPPSAAISGSLQLSYSLQDDYGVTAAEGEIRPLDGKVADDGAARPLVAAPELSLPLPRQRARSGTAKVNRDLTQHPWAGSKVTLTLKAHDDAGQTGSSAPYEMVLPGRNFSNPLALALIEQRRILALDARKAPHVADMLDAITTVPELIEDAAAFMAMRVAYRRIVDARNDDQLRDVLDLLWETALGIEFGDMSEAERKLRDAQEALSKALEENAGDQEIARLMDELRKAMDEYMQMMAREAMKNPLQANPLMQNDMMRMLRQSDLQRMMDQIENLARSGSKDAARQMLSELQRMMDNLRAGRHMQQRQTEGNRMNQALDKLSELMRRQQELMDETFRLEQRRNQLGENRQNRQQQGERQPQEKGFLTAEQLRLLLGILDKTSESGKEEKSAAIRRKEAIARSIEALRSTMKDQNALDAGGLRDVLTGLKGAAEQNRRAFGADRLRRIDQLLERLPPAPGDGGQLRTPEDRHGYLALPGYEKRIRALPAADEAPDAETLQQLDLLLDDLEADSRSSSRNDRETIDQLGNIDREIADLLRRLEDSGNPDLGELNEMTGDTESLIKRLTELLRPQQDQNDGSDGNQGDRSQNGDQQGNDSSDLLNQLLSMLLNMQQEQQQQQGGDGQQGEQGEQGEMTPEQFDEALKRLQQQQEALQQQLGELGKQLEGLGLDPSEQFGEAEGEMGQAGKRLGRGQPGDATGNQAQALDALRRGVQSMMQQMAGDRQQGGQRDGQGQFGELDRNRRDPLGRREGSEGYEDTDATKVPGEIDAQKAREIMEAIRKRLSQPASPRIEKDYLERLLETE